ESELRLVRLIEREPIGRIDFEVVLRIAVEALINPVMHPVDVPADLDAVVAHPLQAGERVIVARLEAALIEVLPRAVAADADDALVIEADEVRIERRRIPAVALQAQ